MPFSNAFFISKNHVKCGGGETDKSSVVCIFEVVVVGVSRPFSVRTFLILRVRTLKNVSNLDVLRNNRPESKSHELFIQAEELSRGVDFERHALRTATRSVYRWTPVGSGNVEDHPRVNIYYPVGVVDAITSDL